MDPRELIRQIEVVGVVRQALLKVGEKPADRNLFCLIKHEHPADALTHKSAGNQYQQKMGKAHNASSLAFHLDRGNRRTLRFSHNAVCGNKLSRQIYVAA